MSQNSIFLPEESATSNSALPVQARTQRPLPHFIRLVQYVACLSLGEATACIRDYREGRLYSGEAVNHFGGTQAVINRAVALRPNVRVYLAAFDTSYSIVSKSTGHTIAFGRY